jgi:hypothetical protein
MKNKNLSILEHRVDYSRHESKEKARTTKTIEESIDLSRKFRNVKTQSTLQAGDITNMLQESKKQKFIDLRSVEARDRAYERRKS